MLEYDMRNQMSSVLERSGQVVFCDFDGPIVDVSERYYRTYKLGLATLQASYQQEQGQYLSLRFLSKHQFWVMKRSRVADTEIALRSGVPVGLVDTLLQQVQRIVNHPHLLQWDGLQPGAETAIRQLKCMGVRLVLVTLRHPRQVQTFLQAHDLSQYIDDIFGAADANAAHLNRADQKMALLEQALAAQQAQGYRISPTCMIGDTEADIIAGQQAGITTLAVTSGIRSYDYLQRYQPSAIASNLLQAVQCYSAQQTAYVA